MHQCRTAIIYSYPTENHRSCHQYCWQQCPFPWDSLSGWRKDFQWANPLVCVWNCITPHKHFVATNPQNSTGNQVTQVDLKMVITPACACVYCQYGRHTTHTHTHNHFTSHFLGLPRWAGASRSELLVYGAREDNRGRHTDHPDGRQSIRTNQWPTSIILPIFTPDALPAATLPLYPGLGQAPNTLAYIPSGVVTVNMVKERKIQRCIIM